MVYVVQVKPSWSSIPFWMDQRTRFGTTSGLGCTSGNWSCLGRANTWVVNAQITSALSPFNVVRGAHN